MREESERGLRSKKPTIKDVAERAGVSKSLVSLVLRDSDRVSERSRAAVHEAIETLGYRPSAAARSLVSGRSGLIGIITSNALDFFFFEIIESVSAHLARVDSGMVPLVSHGTRARAAEELAAERFLQLGVEALMLLGSALPVSEIERLAREVPVTLVGRHIDSDTVDVVVGDDEGGARLATSHLLDLGHRRIAHITGGDGNGAEARERGFRSAAGAAGAEAIVVPGDYTLDGGRRGARRLLDAPGGIPSAIFAANDLCAFGAIETLAMAGHHVPEDVSVIGYDDIRLAGLHGFDLTTINQAIGQMAETACRLTLRRVETGRSEGQSAVMEPTLVVRSSTRTL